MAKFDTISEAQYRSFGKITLSGTTATASAGAVDMQGWQALEVLLHTATVTDAGTAAGFTFKLQESDTLTAASFTDVAAIDAVGGIVSATVTADTDDDKLIQALGYIGNKRYVRVVGTGTTATAADVVLIARVSRGGISKPQARVGVVTATT